MKQENIKKEIGALIERWIESSKTNGKESYTQLKLAKIIGVNQSFISRIIHGYDLCPSDKLTKIIDCLSPSEKERAMAWALLHKARLKELKEVNLNYKINEVSPVNKIKEIPLMGMADAAGFDSAFQSIEEYIQINAQETVLYNGDERAIFALKVEGDSMSPLLPHGSIIFVSGKDLPERGDLVVAKIRESGQVVVKKYHRKDNLVTLESINPTGQNFEWHCKEQAGFAEWIRPVLEYKVNARQQRHERFKNGKE